MSKLLIWRAKPNPAGKDKSQQTPKPSQLNGEWVELKNDTSATVKLEGIQLAHTLYDSTGKPEPKPEDYWTGAKGLTLGAGEVLRIHTGRSADASSMLLEDSGGTDKHAFAEHGNFKLNNKEGDVLYLYASASDKASYLPDVREGAVLTRVGDKLVDLESGGGSGSAKSWGASAILGSSGKAA